MEKNTKRLFYIILSVSIIISLIFIFKFSSLSFSESMPENWVEFINYFGGIINPVLTFINIVIFIKLTNSVQRATENKSWVEKTESLSFTFIESLSILLSEIAYVSNKDQNAINEFKTRIESLNKKVFMNQFLLRIYVESDLFKSCKNSNILIVKSNDIIKKMNGYYNSLDGTNNMENITTKYRELEMEIKDFIKTGKEFSDEIYKL